MKNRPNIDEYFLKFAMLAAERSTCLRHNVGAIIVKDKHILSTGYNGAPKKTQDCTVLGCLRDELKIPSGTRAEICRAVHAEQNAVVQCAAYGVSSKDSTMYCTHQPCTICTKVLIAAGVKRIVYKEPYPDKFAQSLLKEAKIKLIKWKQKK